MMLDRFLRKEPATDHEQCSERNSATVTKNKMGPIRWGTLGTTKIGTDLNGIGLAIPVYR